MLKICKWPGRKNLYIRGSVHGLHYVRSAGTANRKEAEEIAAAVYEELKRRAIYGERRGTPFIEAATRYMKRRPPADHCRHIHKLIDYFRETPIQEIRGEDFLKCAEALYPNVKPQTVRRWCITPLTAILNDAATYIEGYNPPRIKKERWRGDNPRTTWLTPEEARHLYDTGSPYLRAFIILCLDCGCRAGEALSLTRANVIVLPSTGIAIFPRTKNGEERQSSIKRVTAQALLALPESGPRIFWVWGCYSTLNREWHRARLAASLPKSVTPHVLCHTYATWMRIYAHADERTLLATRRWKDHRAVARYMHIAPGELDERLERLPKIA